MDRKQFHYHIRWSSRTALDWECFDTQVQAEARAKELVGPDETYSIEERDETCPRCRAATELKTTYGPDQPANLNANLKYAWQQIVLDAFTELRPECLALKVDAAQQAISARLCDGTPADLDEELAIRDALQSLGVLLPRPAQRKMESPAKKATA
jgi:hypothetical protein